MRMHGLTGFEDYVLRLLYIIARAAVTLATATTPGSCQNECRQLDEIAQNEGLSGVDLNS